MTLEERLEDARRRRAIVLAARDAARQDGTQSDTMRLDVARGLPPRPNQPPTYARRDLRSRPIQAPLLVLDDDRRIEAAPDGPSLLAGLLASAKETWAGISAWGAQQVSSITALFANARVPEVNLRFVALGALLFAAIAVSAMLLRGGPTPPVVVDELRRSNLVETPDVQPVAAAKLPTPHARTEPVQPDVLITASAEAEAPSPVLVAQTEPLFEPEDASVEIELASAPSLALEQIETVSASRETSLPIETAPAPSEAEVQTEAPAAPSEVVAQTETVPVVSDVDAQPETAAAEVEPEPVVTASGKARVRVFVPSGVATNDATQSLAATVETAEREIDRIGTVEFAVSATHVRFYHEADRAEATQLATDAGGEARDFTGAETLPPLGQLELYVAGLPSETVANIETSVTQILDGILN